MKPYYADEHVTLWHGDCREATEWLAADVLVTDPPWGVSYRHGAWAGKHNPAAHAGIAGDRDTSTRDAALASWGSERPALVFGSLRVGFPTGWKKALVFEKPVVGAGLFGQRDPWLMNWEPIFLLGNWPNQTPTRSAVIKTRSLAASGYNGYSTRAGHAHAKPLDVMEALIDACPPGVIADPFAGSGSALVAARNLGRQAIGVEIEERYCELIARRLAQDVLPIGGAA